MRFDLEGWVIQPQAEEHLGPPEAGMILPYRLQRGYNPAKAWILNVWPQDCETFIFVHSSLHNNGGALL